MNEKQGVKMKSKIAFFMSLFFFVATMSPMDPPFDRSGWIQVVAATLVGAISLKTFLSYIHSHDMHSRELFDFASLPTDMQLVIIDLVTRNIGATTLKEVAYTINSLVQVNKELNELLNTSEYCLQIIKRLSERFHCADATAAKALHIKAAKKRLELQIYLDDAHISRGLFHMTEEFLDLLIKKGIDLDFTFIHYEDEDRETPLTPLLLCVALGNYELATLLIERGANINNSQNIWGITPLMQCASRLWDKSAIDFFKYLIKLPKLQINQQDNKKETAFNRFITSKFTRAGGARITAEQTLEIIELFLKVGADPKNPFYEGYTLLEVIKSGGLDVIDQETLNKIIEMIEEAIERKYV